MATMTSPNRTSPVRGSRRVGRNPAFSAALPSSRSGRDLFAALDPFKVNDRVRITFSRDNRTQEVTVTLQELEETIGTAHPARRDWRPLARLSRSPSRT